MNKTDKIYIAGHTGMVGSAIKRNLKSKGYSNIIYRDIKDLDLTNQNAVSTFFEQEKPDYVFLAAAKVGGIVANNTYRAQFIYENIQIQNNIIHSSYQNNIKKLLFLGSSCIYPKNAPQPMTEDALLTGELEFTNEPYAIAKISGINMCESYNMQYGTNFISVMPTNLYGYFDNYNLETSHVLPALIRKMHLGKFLYNNNWNDIRKDLNKRPIEGINGNASEEEILKILSKYGIFKNPEVTITLWGTGSARREFLHADEAADACVFMMENINFQDLVTYLKDHKKTSVIKNIHTNIGSGKDHTIKELAELIQSVVQYNGKVLWDQTKPDGTMLKLLDSSKINQLGWVNKTSLKEGIDNVYINYCQ